MSADLREKLRALAEEWEEWADTGVGGAGAIEVCAEELRNLLATPSTPEPCDHPWPWRIEHDWTAEIQDADGRTVSKVLHRHGTEQARAVALAVEEHEEPEPGKARVAIWPPSTGEGEEHEPPRVEGQHLMAWLSDTLQSAGVEQEDAVAGLLVEVTATTARGGSMEPGYAAFLVEGAARRYAEMARSHTDREPEDADWYCPHCGSPVQPEGES